MLEEQINLSTTDVINIERYISGDGYGSIAKRLGIHRATVKYHLMMEHRKRKINLRSKKHRATRRQKTQKLIRRLLRSSSCVICGFNDPISLEFDHIEPNQKKYEVSQLISKGSGMELLKKELRKCRIVCANCHARHTHMQQNSYKWKAFGGTSE